MLMFPLANGIFVDSGYNALCGKLTLLTIVVSVAIIVLLY